MAVPTNCLKALFHVSCKLYMRQDFKWAESVPGLMFAAYMPVTDDNSRLALNASVASMHANSPALTTFLLFTR
jgi:hypothetical protein